MAPIQFICGGCRKKCTSGEHLKCVECSKVYDLDCANVSVQRFRNTMTKDHKSHWTCYECKSKQPKSSNINTPVRSLSEYMPESAAESDYVTMRKPDKEQVSGTLRSCDGGGAPSNYDEGLKASVPSDRRDGELAELIAEMREFRKEMSLLRISLTERLDDFERRMGAIERRRDEAELERTAEIERAAQLERTVVELKHELNDRDQEALLADLEIGELPEEKGESVVQAVTMLAARLGVTLEPRDVVFAERVGAPPAEAGGRPRRVVVRLVRRHLRDELLSAARVRRGLTGSTGKRVYINERLTRANRQLFNLAREECKKLRWRYSWTKRGRVYVRQADGSPAHQLRSREDVERVLGPHNSNK